MLAVNCLYLEAAVFVVVFVVVAAAAAVALAVAAAAVAAAAAAADCSHARCPDSPRFQPFSRAFVCPP